MKALNILFLTVGVIIGLFLIWIYGVFSYGFVAVKLWTWFVVPIFPTLAAYKFGILQAGGLFMFIRFMTTTSSYKKNDPKKTTSDTAIEILYLLLLPWATLFFGWILHLILI